MGTAAEEVEGDVGKMGPRGRPVFFVLFSFSSSPTSTSFTCLASTLWTSSSSASFTSVFRGAELGTSCGTITTAVVGRGDEGGRDEVETVAALPSGLRGEERNRSEALGSVVGVKEEEEHVTSGVPRENGPPLPPPPPPPRSENDPAAVKEMREVDGTMGGRCDVGVDEIPRWLPLVIEVVVLVVVWVVVFGEEEESESGCDVDSGVRSEGQAVEETEAREDAPPPRVSRTTAAVGRPVVVLEGTIVVVVVKDISVLPTDEDVEGTMGSEGDVGVERCEDLDALATGPENVDE